LSREEAGNRGERNRDLGFGKGLLKGGNHVNKRYGDLTVKTEETQKKTGSAEIESAVFLFLQEPRQMKRATTGLVPFCKVVPIE